MLFEGPLCRVEPCINLYIVNHSTLLTSEQEVYTKDQAVEYELVPTIIVGSENLDMNHSKDEIEDQEDCRDGHIGHNSGILAKTLIAGRIRRSLSSYALILNNISHEVLRSEYEGALTEPFGPCEPDMLWWYQACTESEGKREIKRLELDVQVDQRISDR
jgi:hypothetical protein